MKIGLSLSLCVKDIVENKILLKDVTCLITSTKAISEDDWTKVVADYSRLYWSRDPEAAARIVAELRATGRIVQPRIVGQTHSLAAGNRWIELDSYEAGVKILHVA